jgi:hypothetical protein
MVEYYNTGASGSDTATRVNLGTSDGSTWAIYNFRNDSAVNAAGRKNGGTPTESITGTSQNYAATTPKVVLFIGGDQVNAPALADFAEVLIYNRALTDAELDQVGNYLKTKYALTWTNLVGGGPVALAGTTNGVSTMSGDWAIARALAATSAGVSGMSGELTVTSLVASLQQFVWMNREPMRTS